MAKIIAKKASKVKSSLAKKQSVSLFTLPDCPYCHMAKAWLKAKGIAFTEFDVQADSDARDYILSKSGKTAAPQLLIGKKVLVGFDAKTWEAAFSNKK